MINHMLTQNKKTIAYLLVLLIVAIAGLFNSSANDGFIWTQPTTIRTPTIPAIWTFSEMYIDRSLQPAILAIEDKVIVIGSDDSEKRSNVIAIDANNNVVEIAIQDNLIYAISPASSRYYLLDAITGKVLQKSTEEPPVRHETTLGNILYQKNGNGDILAITQATNLRLWQVNANAISIPVVTPKHIYAINSDNHVIRLDATTGQFEKFIIFEAMPPSPYSAEYNSLIYAYHLAVDWKSNKLFVYMGDSAQLFAFQLAVSP